MANSVQSGEKTVPCALLPRHEREGAGTEENNQSN